MPACGPWRGFIDVLVRSIYKASGQDPREGPSLTRRMTPRPPRGLASSGWLPRGGEFYARYTSRGSADVSHDDQGQAGASARRGPVSSLVQGKQAVGVESRGINQRFPFWCNKTKTARTVGRRSSSSPPHGSIDGLVRPSFNNNAARPSRGAKPHEADDAKTPKGVGHLRRAPEGQRDLCSYLMRLS